MKKIILGIMMFVVCVLLTTKALVIKAATVVTLTDGAAIRTEAPNGIKFEATVSGKIEDATYGMVFAQGTEKDLTIETPNSYSAEVTDVDENLSYRVTMVNFPTQAYTQNISVRAYIKVDNEYTYSENIVTRNIYDVAKAYQNTKGEATEQFVLDIINNCYEITFDTNGGTFKYESLAAMEADFIKDINRVLGKNLSDAKTFFSNIGNIMDDFFKAEGMYDKWIWMVHLFKDLAEGTYGITTGNNAESIKQYNAFIEQRYDESYTCDGITSTYGGLHWAVRQGIQALFTSNYCNEYSKAASPDFSNAEVRNLIDNAIGDNQRTIILGKNAELSQEAYHMGYILEGWYEDKECTVKVTNASKVQTIYANWILDVDNNDINIIEKINPELIVYPNLIEDEITVSGKVFIKGISAFETITEAYSAASAGNKIYVFEGTYNEKLTITKNISIYGPNHLTPGNSETRYAEALLTGIITIQADTVISGIGLTGTSSITTNSSSAKVEIGYIYSNSKGQLNNTYTSVINGTVGELNIYDSYIYKTTVSSNESAISLKQVGTLTISNNLIKHVGTRINNDAIRANTILNKVLIENNIIEWSTSNFLILLGYTSNTTTNIDIKNNTFAGNKDNFTSGLYIVRNTSKTIVNIEQNNFNYMNGNLFNFAYSVSGSQVNITNNIFDENTVFKLSEKGNAKLTYSGNTYHGGVLDSSTYKPTDQ